MNDRCKTCGRFMDTFDGYYCEVCDEIHHKVCLADCVEHSAIDSSIVISAVCKKCRKKAVLEDG